MSTLGDFLPVQASGWGPGTPGGLSEWPLWGIQKGEDLDPHRRWGAGRGRGVKAIVSWKGRQEGMSCSLTRDSLPGNDSSWAHIPGRALQAERAGCGVLAPGHSAGNGRNRPVCSRRAEPELGHSSNPHVEKHQSFCTHSSSLGLGLTGPVLVQRSAAPRLLDHHPPQKRPFSPQPLSQLALLYQHLSRYRGTMSLSVIFDLSAWATSSVGPWGP